jgi:hypothetical protein
MTKASETKIAGATGDPQANHEDNLAPATEPEASGALQEPTIAERVDTEHPAVDDRPRKGLPETSNQIDFNDPTF